MTPTLPGPGDFRPGERDHHARLTPAQIHNLFGSPSMKRSRDDLMNAARETRKVLTDPEASRRYESDDERVKAAVGKWVGRARKWHRMAMRMEGRGL